MRILSYLVLIFVFATASACAYERYPEKYHGRTPPPEYEYDREYPPPYYEPPRHGPRYYETYPPRYGKGYDPYYYEDHPRGKKHDNYKGDKKPHRAKAGWDISDQQAYGAENCYYYSLKVNNGRGSARIMSIPGKNYIQVSNGEKSGNVCFNGRPRLELGKLADPNISVSLYIEDIGSYSFRAGDKGSKHINNWFRAYWKL